MIKRGFTIYLTLIFFAITSYAQQDPKHNSVMITGNVVEKNTGNYMDYATVALLNINDSSLVDGVTTHNQGEFKIHTDKQGKFLLRFSFIGFKNKFMEIEIDENTKKLDLGEVIMSPSVESFDEVNITANRHSVVYKIDRKVINVSEQYASVSGTAADILENVPSIQVDIEGNVSLRGSSNFTVLIDDRPTVLDANDALQQIPAGMIKDIEIITNPSAKFNPEGTAGIINIITKDQKMPGLNGIAHLNFGLDEKYGSDFLLSYNTEKFNFILGADYNSRKYPGNLEERKWTKENDTIFYLNSIGDRSRERESYSVNTGVEYFPNENITVSLRGRYGGRSMKGISGTTFTEWTSFAPNEIIYSSNENWERSGDFYSVSSTYTQEFGSREHKLDADIMLYKREGDEESVNTLRNSANVISNSQISGESGPSQGARYKINYKRPLGEILKMELGLQGRLRDSEEQNKVYYYNTDTKEYEFQQQFSHDVTYNRMIQSTYGLVMGEINNFGFQAGIRGEYTYRKVELRDTGEEFNINRWDYFPTIHTSYRISEKDQIMASYSRRIDRPRGWYLEPFITWSDAYNVRRGNPDIQPEYIDSYEIGYTKDLGDHSLSAELYYRKTKNRIERIRSVYSENVILQTFENVGTDYALGTEIILNLLPVKSWESSLSGNFYDYRVEGQYNDISFDKSSFTWSLRWNNIINITKSTRIQLTPAYHSPEVEAQETEEGYFVMHGAIRQTLVADHLDATLQFRDLLATAKHESEILGDDFYNYRLYTHKSPIVMLNVTWKINNYKNGKENNNSGSDFESEGGGEI